ncbi:indole-3-glycerol phosphate synthase TrpC [Sinomicrobium soli]|uniref:indole-3-glycerol phosphate synthase TrpC n=1 Tax=Sinomicrobium sp. N-1-3-6 TaxID=2219864 RepID=UPI000DCC7BB9|nr:indole-3-glycerol phosphate synthase TrpC [Sinomicrobium sp. N-1-3-6]RAV29826.1 indole-3-glycerol phosphate synthase TrpC [Sinomicrobium sp. N-1-3-6]
MSDILDRIITDKRREVALKKALIPVAQLEASTLFERPTLSLASRLRESLTGIIAEHKRRSPSRAVINHDLSVYDVAAGYEKAGVCGISVLTDGKYFGGSPEDLWLARASTSVPLLRKEFIIDEYQLIEARAYGADVILLIASVLTREEIKSFSELARSLSLEVLLEVHNEEELHKSVMPSLDMLGVNNRNLKTFEVSIETSEKLSALIPDDFVKVSESGISDHNTITGLRDFGYRGFLVGENFMKTGNPGESAAAFIRKLTT